MDLCPLESFKGFAERNSISPLSESNRSVDECIHCYDRPDYECAECACQVCGHKTLPAKRYRCSSCKKVFHEWCQNNISDATSTSDHWQCMNCKPKNLMAPKDNLVAVNSRQTIIRTAARKMNNAPRSSECTIVPANHFGPIPNIPVGTCWEYRLQVSEAGVHRPLVAGIHGRENEGAYSIVLSGVYPDDVDNGDEFFYSGCGGKEKDPSKRLGAQVRNQMLTKQNRALALCCDCPLNDKKGGSAKNWRAGKPVRVIRNYKLAKFSKYAPTEGNRYDGIYKVVKYFPQKGHYGYMIWRYLLKRDDPTPPPWTPKGKRLIAQQGLKMIKASPSILEKAEEFESAKSNPKTPVKRSLEVTISSPKHLIKFKQEFKEERMSPPPSSELIISEDIISDIKQSPTRLSTEDVKLSPTYETLTPVSIKSPTKFEEQYSVGDESNPYSLMDDRCAASNITYRELPEMQNVHTTSMAFTQSLSSLSYLDNAYFPPPLPNHTFLNSSFTVDNDIDLGFKRIKLTKPKPHIVNSDELAMSEPLSIDQSQSFIKNEPNDNSVTSNMEKNDSYELTDYIKNLISKDNLNKSWWDFCLEKYLPLGKQSFIEKVSQLFTCPCCLKIIDKPVTLKCEDRHSACLDCINHRFEIFKARSCPSCQEFLGPSTKIRINDNLSNILLALFPEDYKSKLSRSI